MSEGERMKGCANSSVALHSTVTAQPEVTSFSGPYVTIKVFSPDHNTNIWDKDAMENMQHTKMNIICALMT